METKIDYPIINAEYKHYKGGIYTVMTLATDTVTEKPVVIYRSNLFGSIYSRPLSEWNDIKEINEEIFPPICDENISISPTYQTVSRKRFELIS